jgi:signal transduction histidine kinase
MPTVVLSDIHMPGGDGSSLLQEIRRDPGLRSTQVVLMTGRPDLITPRKGMEEGADDFLVKPVGVKQLISCIDARFNRASISWRVEDQALAQLRSSVPPNLPHELFTPLAGILGLLEILRSGDAGFAPEELADIYRDMHLSAQRLNRTLRNYLMILELQGAASDEAPPAALSRADLERALSEGVEIALKFHERRSDLTLQVTHAPIATRAQDLTYVLEEVVDNAFKFSRPGTPVTVEMTADGKLTVTDHGRGISPADIEQIGAFHQFDRKKQEQQGLGLGLVLVQKLLARGGATFAIKSEPGQGTQVQLAFPLAAA